jgi:hypothetical protein
LGKIKLSRKSNHFLEVLTPPPKRHRAGSSAKFNQQRFHDFILSQGILPPALIREAVIGGVCYKGKRGLIWKFEKLGIKIREQN